MDDPHFISVSLETKEGCPPPPPKKKGDPWVALMGSNKGVLCCRVPRRSEPRPFPESPKSCLLPTSEACIWAFESGVWFFFFWVAPVYVWFKRTPKARHFGGPLTKSGRTHLFLPEKVRLSELSKHGAQSTGYRTYTCCRQGESGWGPNRCSEVGGGNKPLKKVPQLSCESNNEHSDDHDNDHDTDHDNDTNNTQQQER